MEGLGSSAGVESTVRSEGHVHHQSQRAFYPQKEGSGGAEGGGLGTSDAIALELAERKALRSLELKVGAQVVLTVNRPSLGLVNGSRGVVVGLQRDCAVSEGDKEAFGVAAGKYDVPVVRFDDGKTRAVKPSQFFQGGGGGGGRCSGRRSL